ncbi:carbohydrate ABC transporter permease [Streptomyces rubradiris]|uniref:Sugar ABC transporter permease n=1 Tax=Streptomyces rubradiris TaxID=285531 RepID=A0ABQ3RFD3_STRRR|nr:sugar ABC transporter permease [Streptomyces rubradiris]GHG97096.1 sugar ABC transporter permease [Streptomyces rubradiris]GHI54512.1 sugar ABC transporter permease [Streptomyces rubradiris]
MPTTTTRAVTARATEARPRRRPRGSRTLTFWLFTGPFLIGLAVFVYIPIGWSLYLSFFEARFTVTPSEFVGLGNYREILSDSGFMGSLGTFTVFAAFIVPTTWALSLGLALLVNRLRFMRAFYRSVFFLPTACSYVAASLIWKMSLFNGVRFGLANTVLGLFGVDDTAWLASPDPPWYWLVVITARLWLQSGFYMILFLAALQNIPRELYEAAAIDGAKPGWQTFRHITLPQLRATSTAVILLLLVAAYQAFDEFFNLLSKTTWGRPPLVELYYTALGQDQNYGKGSAGAVVLTVLICVVTLFQGRIMGFGSREESK